MGRQSWNYHILRTFKNLLCLIQSSILVETFSPPRLYLLRKSWRRASHKIIAVLLAEDIVSTSASEAYCERVFSICRDLSSCKRNRISTVLRPYQVDGRDSTQLNWTELNMFSSVQLSWVASVDLVYPSTRSRRQLTALDRFRPQFSISRHV